MYLTFLVELDSDDQLTRQRWQFGFHDDNFGKAKLVLDLYQELTRPTKRHKFRFARTYNHIGHRLASPPNFTRPEDVPMPDYVLQSVKEQFMQWADRVPVVLRRSEEHA